MTTTECVVRVAITAPGYYQGTPAFTINAGLTTHRHRSRSSPESDATITGTSPTPSTGLPIAGIEVFGVGGTSTATDATGDYT